MVVWQNPLTGEKQDIPSAIDPGFNYNVGEAASRWRGLIDAARDKLAHYEADLGVRAATDMAALVERDWAQWIEPLLAHPSGEPLKTNRSGWLGAISALDLAHLRQAGIAPVSAEVMLRPGIVAGQKAARHARDGNAMSAEQWRALPALWRQAKALLLDVNSGKPLWILPGAGGRDAQLAVAVDFVTGRPKKRTNEVVSGYTVSRFDLKNRLRAGTVRLLWGTLE